MNLFSAPCNACYYYVVQRSADSLPLSGVLFPSIRSLHIDHSLSRMRPTVFRYRINSPMNVFSSVPNSLSGFPRGLPTTSRRQTAHARSPLPVLFVRHVTYRISTIICMECPLNKHDDLGHSVNRRIRYDFYQFYQ